jgi:hypothetical protein
MSRWIDKIVGALVILVWGSAVAAGVVGVLMGAWSGR